MACTQCGLAGVEGICSMCYGDIDHNTDGEYRRWMERRWQEAEEQRQIEEAEFELMQQELAREQAAEGGGERE